jgi:hypothetical protein
MGLHVSGCGVVFTAFACSEGGGGNRAITGSFVAKIAFLQLAQAAFWLNAADKTLAQTLCRQLLSQLTFTRSGLDVAGNEATRDDEEGSSLGGSNTLHTSKKANHHNQDFPCR